MYGITVEKLTHEELGDGIMSGRDFSMDMFREPDPKSDRMRIVMSGAFPPYKSC